MTDRIDALLQDIVPKDDLPAGGPRLDRIDRILAGMDLETPKPDRLPIEILADSVQERQRLLPAQSAGLLDILQTGVGIGFGDAVNSIGGLHQAGAAFGEKLFGKRLLFGDEEGEVRFEADMRILMSGRGGNADALLDISTNVRLADDRPCNAG